MAEVSQEGPWSWSALPIAVSNKTLASPLDLGHLLQGHGSPEYLQVLTHARSPGPLTTDLVLQSIQELAL